MAVRGKDCNLIKSRRWRLRTYDNVFTGTDLVEWLVNEKFAQDEKHAVEFAQKLLFDQGYCHHVHDDHEFKNEGLFYGFFEDESEAYQSTMAPCARAISGFEGAGEMLEAVHHGSISYSVVGSGGWGSLKNIFSAKASEQGWNECYAVLLDARKT